MSDVNAHLLAQRIDTVLDILVAGDYHSAIHNLGDPQSGAAGAGGGRC